MALVQTAADGDLTAVEQAIAAGADLDAPGPGGRTAVTAAALNEHADVVAALVGAGADIDAQDIELHNPVLVCGRTGNLAVLRAVLRGGPDLTITNRYGGTALIPACERGHVEVVRELLATTDIDVDHVNKLGWTALLEAVTLGDGGQRHQQIVVLLIAAGADLELADHDGVTPLQHARERGYHAIAELLINAAAAP